MKRRLQISARGFRGITGGFRGIARDFRGITGDFRGITGDLPVDVYYSCYMPDLSYTPCTSYT
jgi:hypothetical protein